MSLNRKIIYIEIDEEINSILDRIKKVKEKDVFLVVPAKSLIFQSILNLKILKTKTEDLSKTLTLVTKYARGKELCKNIDLKVIDSLQNKDDSQEIKIKINSIDAYRNDSSDEEPRYKDQSKVSITEIIGKVSQKFKTKTDELKSDYNFYDFSFSRPNRKGLIAIIFLSVSLFFFISYIALPGATIYILPKSDVIESSLNIELADAIMNQKIFEENPPYMVKTSPIEAVFEKKINFDTLSTVFEGTNAQGKIKLVNIAEQSWTLKTQTRFQTKDGLVFRSKEWVTVPAKKADQAFAFAYVNIEADEFDVYKQIIGDRGNIGPTKFIIPGLSAFNQKYVWGESEAPLQGGVSKWSKIVQKEDLEAAKKKVEKDILDSAKQDMKTYIEHQNEINRIDLVLLDNPKYIKKEVLEIRLPENLIGQKKNQIEVYIKLKVTALAYDDLKFKQILKSNLYAKSHPDMQVKEVNFDNVGYDIIDENKTLKIIKISATVNGREEYTVDTSTESGLRFVNKIKSSVLGMSKDDAENYLTNLKEVSQAKISTWPFFSTRLPGLPENIEVKMMEQ